MFGSFKKYFLLITSISIVFIIYLTSCCVLCNPLHVLERQHEDTNIPEKSEEKTVEKFEESKIFSEPEKDLINPEAFAVSSLRIAGQAIDVKVQGSWVYLTDDVGTLYVIDAGNKENPVITGKISRLDSANIVIVKGDYVFLSYTEYKKYNEAEGFQTVKPVRECGFIIVNVKNKSKPEYVGRYISGADTDKIVQGLFIDGNHAFVNSNQNNDDDNPVSRLEIVDITNLRKPKLVSSIRLEGVSSAVFVKDDHAYVNSNFFITSGDELKKQSTSCLYIINIKDKKNPYLESQCNIAADTWALFVRNGYGFVSSNIREKEEGSFLDSKLTIVDINDKKNPKVISECSIFGGAWEIDYEDDYVFVSNLEGGLSIVNVEKKEEPKVVFNLKTSSSSYDIAVSGFYGYLADGFNGLVTVELKNRTNADKTENRSPKAVIDIFGDNFSNNDLPVFQKDNPVYFSAQSSFDPEGKNLTINWDISSRNNQKDAYEIIKDATGKKISVIFKEKGTYLINLEVSDGNKSDVMKKTVKVEDFEYPVIIKKMHSFNVEIEYILKNTGKADLKNLQCFFSIPQNKAPYQKIKNFKIRSEKAQKHYYFDEDWNLLIGLDFGKKILSPGEEISASVNLVVEMPEFYYKKPDNDFLNYKEGDTDITLFTADNFFIDSDNPIIIEKAATITGNEKNPYEIAKKIYNFVIKTLHYDFNRADDKNYKFMYASEILKEKKGVCLDYAILYTALLRAAKIPSRLAGGIPVTAILLEDNKEISVGHEWVEIKLPGYGWIPVDPTAGDPFLSKNYYMNLTTDKGMSLLYSRETMDWSNYYYEGFKFFWDSSTSADPAIEQNYKYRVDGVDIKDLFFY